MKITPPHRLGMAVCALILSGCGGEAEPPVVGFTADVMPILRQHCHECHLPGGEGEKASGLNMADYAGLMKGTKYGPIIKPGDSVSSTLVILVEGKADPSINMPHGSRPPLSKDEVEKIRRWIDAGANNN